MVDGLKLLLLITTACVLGAPGAAASACLALLDHRFNSLQGKPAGGGGHKKQRGGIAAAFNPAALWAAGDRGEEESPGWKGA